MTAAQSTYDLANNLLIRMKEIDRPISGGLDDRPPDGDDYNLLWDAILDEIRAVCPDLDYGAILQPSTETDP